MDYKTAKDIRKKSFGTLLAEQEGGFGSSFKKTLSQKTQARMTGIKETFDPMNIAKKMTFGSNFAPAMVGKLFGAKQENINYFTGAKKKDQVKPLENGETGEMSTPSDVLGLIYRLMLRIEEEKKTSSEQEKNYKEEQDREENAFYDELMRAITGRKKPKKKPKAKKEEPKKETEKAAKGQVKETPKAPKQVPKETPKAPKEVVKPKAEKILPKASTAAKIAGTAAIATVAGLGGSSAKFESNGDPSTVSSGMMGGGKKDPGGISYGTYQMSSVMGVADDFVKKSEFKSDFSGMKAGTPEFGAKWKELAKDPQKGQKFAEAQHDYIKKTHFDPAANKAMKMGYNLNDPGVADAIWSLSVQHGGVQKVLDLSKANMGGIVSSDSKTQIRSLYKARDQYTNGQFNKRYSAEVDLALNKSTDTGVRLAENSTQNKEMKEDLTKKKVTNTQIASTTQSTTQTAQVNPVVADDTNPYLRKLRG